MLLFIKDFLIGEISRQVINKVLGMVNEFNCVTRGFCICSNQTIFAIKIYSFCYIGKSPSDFNDIWHINYISVYELSHVFSFTNFDDVV